MVPPQVGPVVGGPASPAVGGPASPAVRKPYWGPMVQGDKGRKDGAFRAGETNDLVVGDPGHGTSVLKVEPMLVSKRWGPVQYYRNKLRQNWMG